MSGPSTKPKRGESETRRYKPHPDDEADVRAALAEVERGEALSAADSAAVLRWMESGDASDLSDVSDERVRRWAETGEWPESSG